MKKNYTLALVLILLGVLLFVKGIGVDLPIKFWHAVLFVVGIGIMLSERRVSLFSGCLSLVALYLMLYDLQEGGNLNLGFNLPKFSINYIWALLLVALGLSILFKKSSHHVHIEVNSSDKSTVIEGEAPKSGKNASKIDVTAVFSGNEVDYTGEGYINGKITAVFGGAEVDISRIVPAGNDLYLDVAAVFGGIELRIPQDWHVERKGTTVLFGGIDAKGNGAATSGVTLHVSGIVLFGGLEIKRG